MPPSATTYDAVSANQITGLIAFLSMHESASHRAFQRKAEHSYRVDERKNPDVPATARDKDEVISHDGGNGREGVRQLIVLRESRDFSAEIVSNRNGEAALRQVDLTGDAPRRSLRLEGDSTDLPADQRKFAAPTAQFLDRRCDNARRDRRSQRQLLDLLRKDLRLASQTGNSYSELHSVHFQGSRLNLNTFSKADTK